MKIFKLGKSNNLKDREIFKIGDKFTIVSTNEIVIFKGPVLGIFKNKNIYEKENGTIVHLNHTEVKKLSV